MISSRTTFLGNKGNSCIVLIWQTELCPSVVSNGTKILDNKRKLL